MNNKFLVYGLLAIVLLFTAIISTYSILNPPENVDEKTTKKTGMVGEIINQRKEKEDIEVRIGTLLMSENIKIKDNSNNEFDMRLGAMHLKQKGYKEGIDILLLKITLENNSDKTVDYNAITYRLKTSDGVSGNDPYGYTIPSPLNQLLTGQLKPGESITGGKAFSVPSDAENFELDTGKDKIKIFAPKLNS